MDRLPTVLDPVVLVAINARYSHPSLGLRYLLANLGGLRDRAVLREFTLRDTPANMADDLLATAPALVAIGVYIWNRTHVEALVDCLQEARPELPIVLGGPEISYDLESNLAERVTCVLCGEADRVFGDICVALLRGASTPSVIRPDPPPLSDIALPYREYTTEDIAHRTLYVETSRGCPCRCEYCISSLTPGMRTFDLDQRILPALQELIDRGATRFKFVDRSFNLNAAHACAVLDFFLPRWQPGMCLHLEMTPDRLGAEFRSRLLRFPPGALHIEVGIQTFNPDVAHRVGRRLPPETADTVSFLVDEVHADVHGDLIAGLPGETPASFEAGINRLIALRPSELQVGILKRLHGAPIARHEADWSMCFRETPPYDILSTSLMDEAYLDGIRRFAFHWERIVNRHHLPNAVPLIWQAQPSAFAAFNAFSLWLEERLQRQSPGLVELAEALFEFLTHVRHLPRHEVQRVLREDYLAEGRRVGLPRFLRSSS